MPKKTIKYIVLFFLLSVVVYGQSIKGKVVDATASPVSFATIALIKSSDSTIIRGSLSDENGNFIFQKISTGSYTLKISAVGFNETYTNSIQLDSASVIDLPNIVLTTSEINLSEVSVSAIKKTVEFKNGNVIVSVVNSPLAKGNTIYDLLSKLPGITVDDNVIRLNGKEGVIIMIDGRAQQISNVQLLNLLKSMNAETVEKIEIYKNPPAKYDAAGTSGMINIKTKKTKLMGLSGSAYSSISQGFYCWSMSGVSLNYKSKKVTFFSGLDYNYGTYQLREKFNKKFSTDTSVTEFNATNTINELDNSLSYKIGADWFLNKKNTIGFRIDGGPGSYTSESNGTNTIAQYNNMGFDHLTATTYAPDKWIINNYNFNAEHRFDTTGSVLNFAADYTRLSEKYSNSIQNYFFDINNIETLPPTIYQSSNISASDIFASKLDFTKIINAKSSFEAGAKTSFITTSNNYLFEIKDNATGNFYQDTALTNNYTYAEQTYAGYFNYIRSFEKINLQAGLRGEITNLLGRNTVKGFELKRSYYNLFPTISVDFKKSENHTFQLNVNRRIDRPQYGDLNPFRNFRDKYSYFEGNPFVLPHYSNTIELTHVYKESIINGFSYNRVDNVMLHYTKQNDSTKTTTETIKNMKLNNRYTYSFYFQHSLKSWWDMSGNAVVSYIEYLGDVNGVKFKTASFYYTPSLTNTFIAPKNTKIEIISFYRSAKNNGLVQVKPRWMLSFAIKKSFFNNALDCSIGVNDVFYSFVGRTGVKFDNQNWNFTVMQDTRRLVLSINYNFGKIKVQEREISSNDQEKGRLSH